MREQTLSPCPGSQFAIVACRPLGGRLLCSLASLVANRATGALLVRPPLFAGTGVDLIVGFAHTEQGCRPAPDFVSIAMLIPLTGVDIL